MPKRQPDPIIAVSLYVDRVRILGKDERLLEVWGHVADYEVMITLPIEDERSQLMIEHFKLKT